MRNYLVVGYDSAVCESLWAHQVCCGSSTLLRGHPGVAAWGLSDGGEYGNRREKTILFTLKLQTLLAALDAGVRRVVHIDLDIVLLRPPMALLAGPAFGADMALAFAVDMPSLDARLQQTCLDGGAAADALAGLTAGKPRLNTGIIYAAASATLRR